MKQLFTDEELNNSKYGTKFPCECYHCGITFYIKKGVITNIKNDNYNPKSQPKGKYCSRECSTNSKKNKPNVTCKECGVGFNKFPSAIKRSKNHFCTPSCATKYNNVHRIITDNNRSKLEKWLEEKLTNLYPNLEVHFNRKDKINSELDIYIPSLNLGFELNGVFHYEPIFGIDKLEKVKNNDNRKFQACIEHGISLCVINTSDQIYFKEKTSKKYLDIIVNIIDNQVRKK